MSRWESGHRRPDAATAEKLAAALDLAPAAGTQLFDGYPVSQRDNVGTLPGLRMLLEQEGLSEEDVALATARPLTMVHKWCTGERVIATADWMIIAELLGARPEALATTARATTSGILAQLRRDRGHTQAHIAGALGVTRTAVSRWEGPGCLPPSSRRRALALALGMPYEELLRALGINQPRRPPGREADLRCRNCCPSFACGPGRRFVGPQTCWASTPQH